MDNLAYQIDLLKKTIRRQGPISVIVTNNPLQKLEDQDFHDAQVFMSAKKNSGIYRPLEDFISDFKKERFSTNDIKLALDDASFKLFHETARKLHLHEKNIHHLIRFFLLTPFNKQNDKTLHWHRQHDDSKDLMNFFFKCTHDFHPEESFKDCFVFNKNLLEQTNESSYRFFSSFFDEGLSLWPMPKIDGSLIKTYLAFNQSNVSYKKNPIHDLIDQTIRLFHIKNDQLEDFLWAVMVDIQGYASLVFHYEFKKMAPVSFEELLLVRLMMLVKAGLHESWSIISKPTGPSKIDLQFFSYTVYKKIYEQDKNINLQEGCIALCELARTIDEASRKKILQQAYENSYYQKVLNQIDPRYEAARSESYPYRKEVHLPFSAIFCLDDREESYRRHLESINPECITYGWPGFFNIDMLFKKLSSKKPYQSCPIGMNPTKIIEEKPISSKKIKKTISSFTFFVEKIFVKTSRSFFSTILFHFSFLIFTAISDALFFVFPKIYSKSIKKFKDKFLNHTKTVIDLHITEISSERFFAKEELTVRLMNLIKTIGLEKKWTDLIFVLGHKSEHLNNPHQSAYHCGACSGQDGGINARVFAQAANDPEIRSCLSLKGLTIPDNVRFIGGVHDTASDEIELYDTEDLPFSLKISLREARKIFKEASYLNAKERARRFVDMDHLSAKQVYKKLQSRVVHYAQPRPEYGHATNALCIVGKRERTQGVFLDRRAFLCSYDWENDKSGELLASLLLAITPVCSGINLEYYFSHIDNKSFGCGTKLPHNVCGLIGVMNGHLSDIGTGLSWQMVEIHEPMRLMFVIECPLEKFLNIKDKISYVTGLVKNQWIHMRLLDPIKNEIIKV